MARKKQFDYFGELNQLATNAYEAAKVLQEIVDNYSLENLVKKSEAIHQLEKENDEIVRKILMNSIFPLLRQLIEKILSILRIT